MSADPIVGMDIGAAAAALAAGEATPSQLLDTYLERIEALEPTLNCFITITSDLARAQARSADRRHADRRPRSVLDGIPIGLKDNIDVAGIPTTNGTGRAVVADVDARIVTGLKDAGAILVGKLNLHEAALGATTDNPHHGRTVNPHRLGYTPGGSSGGSGAAVAAGLCLAAIGSDTLGSVRLPAAYCGVVGFKPSPRHGGCQGVAPLMPELDTLGPLARTVRDAAQVWACGNAEEFDVTPARVDRIRLGRLANLEGEQLTPSTRQLYSTTAARLEALVHSAHKLRVADFEPTSVRRAALLLIEHRAYALHEPALREHPGPYSDPVHAMLAFGRDAPESKLERAREIVASVADSIPSLFDRVDVIASPTAPQPAFDFDAPVPPNQADLTAFANLAGCPAISLPCGLSGDGLPVGFQLVGAPGEDRRLLSIALAVEDAHGIRAHLRISSRPR